MARVCVAITKPIEVVNVKKGASHQLLATVSKEFRTGGFYVPVGNKDESIDMKDTDLAKQLQDETETEPHLLFFGAVDSTLPDCKENRFDIDISRLERYEKVVEYASDPRWKKLETGLIFWSSQLFSPTTWSSVHALVIFDASAETGARQPNRKVAFESTSPPINAASPTPPPLQVHSHHCK